jgi:uncharacterized protein with ACT and thioredoxin-like domain
VVKTLSISCKDKMGLLAVVCSIISDSGHNIKVSVQGLVVHGWGGGDNSTVRLYLSLECIPWDNLEAQSSGQD